MGQSTSQAGSQAPGGQAARQPGSRLRPSPSPSSPRLSVPPVFLSLSLSLSLCFSPRLSLSPSLALSLPHSVAVLLSRRRCLPVRPSVCLSACLVLSWPVWSGLVCSGLAVRVSLSLSLSLSVALGSLRSLNIPCSVPGLSLSCRISRSYIRWLPLPPDTRSEVNVFRSAPP